MADRGRRVLVAIGLVAALGQAASADVHRLGVAGDEDGALVDAVTTALEPWEVEVVALGEVPTGLGDAAEIASRHGVDALMWLSPGGDGHTLWIYDAGDSKILGKRAVGAPPFDAPTAAAVALSVKTLLRHSPVAPVVERFGAIVIPSPPPQPPPPPPPVAAEPERLFLAAGAGARTTGEPRLEVRVVWHPGGRWLGLTAGLDAGPGLALDEPDFVGRFDDVGANAGARAAMRLGPVVAHGQAALTAHVTRIDGVVISREQPAEVVQLNPGAAAEIGVRGQLAGALHAELAVGGEVALRRQRYTVQGDPVYTVPRVSGYATLRLSVPFL